MSIQWNNEDYLAHYGVPRRSGRYKWGSGKDPYHHGASLPSGKKKTIKKEYKERKKENKEAYKSIKKGLNKEYTTKSRRILREEVSLDNKLYAAKNKYQEANKKYDDAYEKAYLHDTIHGRPITGRDRRAQIDNWSAVRREQENRLNAKKQFKDDATSITAKKKVLDKQFEDLADKHMADRRAAYKDYKGAKKDLKNTYKDNNKEYKQTEEYRKARNKKIMAVAAGATVAATTAYFATHPEARSKISSMMKNAGHSDKKISELPSTNRLALPSPNSPNSPKQYTASSQKSNSSSRTRIGGVTKKGGLYKQIPQGVSTHKGGTPRRLYNDGIARGHVERIPIERIPIDRVPLNPSGTVTRRRKRKK